MMMSYCPDLQQGIDDSNVGRAELVVVSTKGIVGQQLDEIEEGRVKGHRYPID